MFDNDIGKFIKTQREKNHISQTKLSELLYVDRTLISKWENNKLTPNIKEIINMSKIFNISIEEFLSTEEYNKDNKEEINQRFNDYLINQDNKLTKFRKLFTRLLALFIFFVLAFLIYYFYQTYNKTRVYRISGVSSNYEFNSGILLITRSKSYLKIGSFDENISKIKIYYNLDKEKVIYEGEPDEVCIDYTNYDSSINLHNMDNIKDIIYMDIYDNNNNVSTMKLYFDRDFSNDKFIYKERPIYDLNDKNEAGSNNQKIFAEFTCDSETCKLSRDGIDFTYDVVGNVLYITSNKEVIIYNIDVKSFSYTYKTDNFVVNNGKFLCYQFGCEKAYKIYDYYMNYILEYLND